MEKRTMDWFWIAAAVVAVVVVFTIAFKGKDKSKRISLFRQRDALFTAAERSFLGVLDQANAGRYRVFGKVRIADVIAPAKGLDKSTWTRVFNRIKAKHFDFVLCDPQTLKVKAVIELNDKSHTSSRRVERDELVGSACADAGLALRIVKAQRRLRSSFELNRTGNSASVRIRLRSQPIDMLERRLTPEAAVQVLNCRQAAGNPFRTVT
jgi:hypothetical protein